MSEDDTRIVVFVDSMGDDDLANMDFVREQLRTGTMDAGPVYVTPVVLGSIYTGQGPATTGLPAVSRYDQSARLRPNAPTLPEMAADQGLTTLQMGLPFIVPPQSDAPGDTYWHLSSAMGQQSVRPDQAAHLLSTPAPAGSLDKPGENLDLAFNLRVDHSMVTFGTVRNLMEQMGADVVFVAIRTPDSYCHYHYPDGDDGRGTYRDQLLQQIDREIEYLANQGEVFVFGDHGATDMERTVRVNRWLMDEGYLDVTIDHEWRRRAQEYGVVDEPGDTGQVLQAGAPGVSISEQTSVAISDDPFSGGITLLDGATEDSVANLRTDLARVPGIEQVTPTAELFDAGPLLDEAPDLYAVREEGTFVSGNLAPEPGGPEVTRSGVHHRTGAWGTSDPDVPVPDQDVSPTGLFGAIAEFIGLDGQATTAQDGDYDQTTDRDVRSHLEDLGYI